ncbi:MAG: ABC transporter permease subunit [Candidatus Bathyarchaeia archaeon]|jgi:ABC-type Na+ efflux pump permease subunit
MNLSSSWIIATKELKIFKRKRSIILGTIFFPLLLDVLFPLVILYAQSKSGGIPAAFLPGLLNAFAFFFVIAAATLPSAIASYAIVGEKVEKSLEPLLATPTTDGEILLGKSIAAFIPPALASWSGLSIFMVLMDRLTYSELGYILYPSWSIAVIFLLVPIAAVLSIELSIIASSRVSDVRSANSVGGIMFIPFMVIYLAGEIGVITLNPENLLIISVAILFVDLALFYFSIATFRREEILTKWK